MTAPPPLQSSNPERLAGEATVGYYEGAKFSPANMVSTNSPNQFITREGEAPAEPWRRKLDRSLALPMVLTRSGIAKMFGAEVYVPQIWKSKKGDSCEN